MRQGEDREATMVYVSPLRQNVWHPAVRHSSGGYRGDCCFVGSVTRVVVEPLRRQGGVT